VGLVFLRPFFRGALLYIGCQQFLVSDFWKALADSDRMVRKPLSRRTPQSREYTQGMFLVGTDGSVSQGATRRIGRKELLVLKKLAALDGRHIRAHDHSGAHRLKMLT
jgi:hypothetical protein